MKDVKEMYLLGKLVKVDECPVLFKYSPAEDWQQHFEVMDGNWKLENGWLVGWEPGNKGGILFTKKTYDNIIFSFTAKTVLPATRDVNALFSAHWDKENDTLGNAYVVGLNGWWEGKSGIERNPENLTRSLTGLYKYTPGAEVRITTGVINGHVFLYADGELVAELVDPDYISGGHAGFSPYSTMLAIKDIEIREAVYSDFLQSYTPEF